MEKRCTGCKIIKIYSEFVRNSRTNDGMSYDCKSCKRLRYLVIKKRKLSGENFVVEKTCKICQQVKPRKDFTLSATRDGLYPYCKECNRKVNKEKYHTEEGKKSHRTNTNKYVRNKYKTNEKFRASVNLNRSFNLLLITGRKKKQWSKCENLIGYEITEFIDKVGNKPSSEYQIDHKIPITWFFDDCPFSVIWDIRNLWWVTKEYNIRKGNKWCDDISDEYLEVIKPYMKKELVFEKNIDPLP